MTTTTIHDDTGTLEWTLSEYYFYVFFSIFNIILFSFLLLNMSCLPLRFKRALMDNKYALLLWISIIIRSTIAIFINTSIVSNCCQQGIQCSRCSISGSLEQGLAITSFIIRLFVVVKVIEINIQPFPTLAYPSSLIITIKAFILVLFTVYQIAYFILLKIDMRVVTLEADKSIQICTQSHDHETIEKFQTYILCTFAPIFLTCYIFLCLLFLRKVATLYTMTKTKVYSSTETIKPKDGLRKLSNIIRPIIRHSTLAIVGMASPAIFILLMQMVNSKGVPLYPIDDFITGLCVVMMFPFGQKCFHRLCGCVEKPITKKWLKIQAKSLQRLSYGNIEEEHDKTDTNQAIVVTNQQDSIIPTVKDQSVPNDLVKNISETPSKTQTEKLSIRISKWSVFSIQDPATTTESVRLAAIREFL